MLSFIATTQPRSRWRPSRRNNAAPAESQPDGAGTVRVACPPQRWPTYDVRWPDQVAKYRPVPPCCLPALLDDPQASIGSHPTCQQCPDLAPAWPSPSPPARHSATLRSGGMDILGNLSQSCQESYHLRVSTPMPQGQNRPVLGPDWAPSKFTDFLPPLPPKTETSSQDTSHFVYLLCKMICYR